jgi:ferrous iron transport protein B
MSAVAPAARELTVVLIGNPNTGKSTLFNALSGLNARVGNFPGCTVEKKLGRLNLGDRQATLVDLPGTYSLSPRSIDEMVSVDVLLGRVEDVARPDVVVCIVDASNLERNLYLFSQIRDIGVPVVLCLNMHDVAVRRGVKLNVEQLSARLGVPVVTTSAHKRVGVQELLLAINNAAAGPKPAPQRLFPEVFHQEVAALSAWFAQHGLEVPEYLVERTLLDVGGESEHRYTAAAPAELPRYVTEARQRLAAAGCKVPATETKVRYGWIRQQLTGIYERPAETRGDTATDRIDRVVTSKFLGVLIFAALMLLVFITIFSAAEPLMTAIEKVTGWFGGLVEGAMAPGTLRSLLVDGLVAGVGSVIVFVPQIALLFLFIALMEDCGYMARAAFLMDKLMTKIGLSGKSFLPLMSSFACAIPGIMATRVIENRRDRMVTILIAPLMSCSARLPVYVLLIAAFIPTTRIGGVLPAQGLTMFLMYLVGVLVAIPVAWLLKKTFFPGETPPFVMELPEYKWPSLWIVLTRVYDRVKAFLGEAGTLIFCTSVIVWALGYFPENHTKQIALQSEIAKLEETPEDERDDVTVAKLETLGGELNEESGRLIEQSYLGRMGHAIEPAVRPLGWDWKIGVGVISSFPAREVIISTLGTIYSLGGDVDEEDDGLRTTLQNATWQGTDRKVFNIPVALSVMVFFALCAQCAATLMVIRRETNSWRWPIFTFTYMTVLAYVGAFVTYRVALAFV